MLITRVDLTNRTIITSFFDFYLNIGLECTHIHRFVEYTALRCFNIIVRSAVNASRQSGENLFSSVVDEMKLLVNSSYRYLFMDRSPHTVTKHLNKKSYEAVNSKRVKSLNYLNDKLYEVEAVKPEVEHEAPIIAAFFILQLAKVRMLELDYIFSTSFVTSIHSKR